MQVEHPPREPENRNLDRDWTGCAQPSSRAGGHGTRHYACRDPGTRGREISRSGAPSPRSVCRPLSQVPTFAPAPYRSQTERKTRRFRSWNPPGCWTP